MSKPRGQKAPRRFPLFVSGYELPATSQHELQVWLAICRNGGRLRTVIIATASAMLIGSCFASSTSNAATRVSEDACAADTRHAVAAARQALHDDRDDNDRIALACLVEAVAALEERLQGLADGSAPFEGQIYAPKGVAMTKPSSQEGR